MLIIVVVVRAGLPGYITRELAICFDQNRPDLAAQIWRKAQCIVLIGSLIAVVTAILILCQIEFVDSEIRSTFYIAMLMVPLLGIIGLFRGLFCAHKNVIFALIPESLIRPSLIVGTLLIFTLASTNGSPALAMLVNVAGTFGAIIFCYQLNPARKSMAKPSQKINLSTSMFIAALPFLFIASMHILNTRTDKLMIGIYSDMESVGIYSIASQVSVIVSFPVLALNSMLAPYIAETTNNQSEGTSELQRQVLFATTISFFIACMIFAGIYFLSPFLLSYLGNEFLASFFPLCILALTQLFNVASGPAGMILSMSGREKIVGKVILAGALINISLNIIFIPLLGINGAAIASAISTCSWNVALVWICTSQVKLKPTPYAFLFRFTNLK